MKNLAEGPDFEALSAALTRLAPACPVPDSPEQEWLPHIVEHLAAFVPHASSLSPEVIGIVSGPMQTMLESATALLRRETIAKSLTDLAEHEPFWRTALTAKDEDDVEDLLAQAASSTAMIGKYLRSEVESAAKPLLDAESQPLDQSVLVDAVTRVRNALRMMALPSDRAGPIASGPAKVTAASGDMSPTMDDSLQALRDWLCHLLYQASEPPSREPESHAPSGMPSCGLAELSKEVAETFGDDAGSTADAPKEEGGSEHDAEAEADESKDEGEESKASDHEQAFGQPLGRALGDAHERITDCISQADLILSLSELEST